MMLQALSDLPASIRLLGLQSAQHVSNGTALAEISHVIGRSIHGRSRPQHAGSLLCKPYFDLLLLHTSAICMLKALAARMFPLSWRCLMRSALRGGGSQILLPH